MDFCLKLLKMKKRNYLKKMACELAGLSVMKLNIFTVSIFLTAFSVCTFNTAVQAQRKETKINMTESNVHWLGKKVTGQHEGNIKLKNGNLKINGNKIEGGSFTIDMTSIVCTDITDVETNKKFIGHVTTGDFFEVDKYPISSLEITKVRGSRITGNLTIHGVTQPISFTYSSSKDKNSMKVTAQLTIDRTAYGIKYGSKNFFASIGDKAIDDLFTLDVTLVAATQ
jgi:polyisoprenoid-binding protein YceI